MRDGPQAISHLFLAAPTFFSTCGASTSSAGGSVSSKNNFLRSLPLHGLGAMRTSCRAHASFVQSFPFFSLQHQLFSAYGASASCAGGSDHPKTQLSLLNLSLFLAQPRSNEIFLPCACFFVQADCYPLPCLNRVSILGEGCCCCCVHCLYLHIFLYSCTQ